MSDLTEALAAIGPLIEPIDGVPYGVTISADSPIVEAARKWADLETQVADGDVIALTARLGWSNHRGGTEIYNDTGEDRWGNRLNASPDGSDADWGDILVDHLEGHGASEGTHLIVLAFPSRFDKDKRDALFGVILGEGSE